MTIYKLRHKETGLYYSKSSSSSCACWNKSGTPYKVKPRKSLLNTSYRGLPYHAGKKPTADEVEVVIFELKEFTTEPWS